MKNTLKKSKNKNKKTRKNDYKKYELLSPFELKDHLIKLAKNSKSKQYLNAGRGNPNFFNSFVRETYTYLQLACLNVSKSTSNKAVDTKTYYLYNKEDDYKKMLIKELNKINIPKKNNKFIILFLEYLDSNKLIHDLIISMIGCFYPSPPRIQPSLEKVIREFMYELIFENKRTKEKKENYEYFAVEGAAAGILYVFNSLLINGLLNKGDTIAIITPIFSPYLEMPKMESYGLKIIELKGDPEEEYALSDNEINKLKNKKVKALFMVNPGNPTEYCLPLRNIERIGEIVKNERKDLIVVSDSVYAPFVNEFNSFMYSCPKNTIEIYSLSKYFGVTGWRLGVVMIRKENNLNELLNNLNDKKKRELRKRYSLASTKPDKLSLMSRIVMDSRQVAEAHVGGLSTPQQMMMALMTYYQDHICGEPYKKQLRDLLMTRMKNTYSKFKYIPQIDEKSTNYYSLINILLLTEKTFGKDKERIIKKHHPYKLLFRLASKYGIVLLPGKGFGATKWKFRISLANLPTDDYNKISNGLYKAIEDIVK